MHISESEEGQYAAPGSFKVKYSAVSNPEEGGFLVHFMQMYFFDLSPVLGLNERKNKQQKGWHRASNPLKKYIFSRSERTG